MSNTDNCKPRRLLSTKEAAAKVSHHPKSLLIRAKDPNDDFPAAIALSTSRWAFYEDEIDAWLESRRTKAAPCEAAQ